MSQAIWSEADDYVLTDSGGIQIRFGDRDRNRFLEFPNEDWLDVAAILYLPPAGFRVHVIRGPEKQASQALG